ncbi:MAG TPA: tRNA (5-methylaminomethyl-2-thiouridine)(34)-methyltransferase MnmD [Balneolaceae bacterium]|nr:tRNA (5-methylaminomethyl-2-thiouridine)(34)-methyltransferase MnmD [Balneolaceae bacterium]
MAKNSKNPELKITGDGSHTLYSTLFDQDYHNANGAISESRHVFFEQNGLKQALAERDHINILEIGFGTGLNFLLLMDYHRATKNAAAINYHSIEGYPISADKATKLNYADYLNYPPFARKLSPVFDQLKPGINSFSIVSGIKLSIFNGFFDDYEPGDLSFDFIFHDAFSPRANPELWQASVFKRLLSWSDPRALLSTYCAASKPRGAMAHAGWKVARASGALGKREMTVASPSTRQLDHLKRVNEERLARRYEEDDF